MKKKIKDIKRELKYSPSLTIGLMIFITILFFLQPEDAALKYGLTIKAVSAEPWRLITSHFVHLGESHFLMNALGLIFLGGILENAGVKRKHMLQGIVMALVFSNLFILMSQIVRPSLVIGFSGIVYGLIGMMVSIVGWRGVLGLAVLFFGFGILTAGGNIAWSGHIGGFIGGLIIGRET